MIRQIDGNPIDEVIELLKMGTDLKRLHHQSAEAEELLRRADALVDAHDLPKPWPQLVSYRLAHVLLRSAKTENDFQEIDQLLAIASAVNCLGPLPRLYRLAVLSRLGRSHQEMKPTVTQLIRQIDNHSYDEYDQEDREEGYQKFAALQSNIFNMLELAVYFTGYPYEGFEGRGLLNLEMHRGTLKTSAPYSDLFSRLEAWRLIGTMKGLSSAAYPGEVAIEELEARMERGDIQPPCIAFQISSDLSIHRWNVNLEKELDGSFTWNKVRSNATFLLFLAAILYPQRIRSRSGLLAQIFNDSSTADNTFRKRQQRCSEALLQGLQSSGNLNKSIDLSHIFLANPSGGDTLPELNPNIAALGAIDQYVVFE